MKIYTKYYVAESHGLFGGKHWHPTKAETLAGAKRAARNRQRYQGTNLLIATPKIDGTPRIVAWLDKGRWIDRD